MSKYDHEIQASDVHGESNRTYCNWEELYVSTVAEISIQRIQSLVQPLDNKLQLFKLLFEALNSPNATK